MPEISNSNWYCRQCRRYVAPEDVTFSETHDERKGGCGQPVGEGPVRLVDQWGEEEGPYPYMQFGKPEVQELERALWIIREALRVCRQPYLLSVVELHNTEAHLSQLVCSIDDIGRIWLAHNREKYKEHIRNAPKELT